MRNGDLLCRPDLTDSHSDLIEIFGIQEDGEFTQHYAKIELTWPDDMATTADVSTWKFAVDERAVPDWMDAERAERLLRERLARMIVTGKRAVVWDGAWILCGDASIERVRGVARIIRMLGTSRVGEMRETSRVGEMWGTSQVGGMWGTSQVGTMRETSRVGEMRGTSRVGGMRGTSQVGTKGPNVKTPQAGEES